MTRLVAPAEIDHDMEMVARMTELLLDFRVEQGGYRPATEIGEEAIKAMNGYIPDALADLKFFRERLEEREAENERSAA